MIIGLMAVGAVGGAVLVLGMSCVGVGVAATRVGGEFINLQTKAAQYLTVI